MTLKLYKCYLHKNNINIESYVIANNILEAEQEAINELLLKTKNIDTDTILKCYRIDILAEPDMDNKSLIFTNTRDVGEQLRISQLRSEFNRE